MDNLRIYIRKILIEMLNNPNFDYEFHLSTEPNLKEGVPFSKQIRTTSSNGERGNMETTESGMIYTTDSPEQWYEQFEMELGADAPEAMPNYLYLVKVKNPSQGSYLSQAVNKPDDVTIIKQIPNIHGKPNFRLGYQIKDKLENQKV